MSARKYDTNGWYEIEKNPISKVGVFPYLGKSIGAPIPDKIYQVYRPASELSDPETIKSFRLVPWIVGHTMLGEGRRGFKDVGEVGAGGTIGERVFFENGTLYANLKCWGKDLADAIDGDEDELSCGYLCKYDFTPGVFEGTPYDVVQRHIRGNHLASLEEGRMGSEVAVMDSLTFTVDAKDFRKTMDEDTKAKILAAAQAIVAALTGGAAPAAPGAAPPAAAPPAAPGAAPPAAKKPVADAADPEAEKTAEDEVPPEIAKDEDDAEKTAEDEIPDAPTPTGDAAVDMKALTAHVATLTGRLVAHSSRPTLDAADVMREMGQRDKLADSLKDHVGTFDHSEMSLAQVAAYGVGKLGIKVPKGQETAALSGFLAAAGKAKTVYVAAADAAVAKATEVPAFVTRAKAPKA